MDDLINGIVQKIRTLYPSGQYAVYREAVEQGLKEPCFFVFQITQNIAPVIAPRYQCNASYVIQYMPSAKGKRAECMRTAETLYELLETVNVNGDLYRGTGMRHEIQQEILHFFVEYNYFILRPREKGPIMEEVKANAKIKE